MNRVVTFGEIMLRLAPNGYYRFFQNDQLQATFGGSEANFAVSLGNYGINTSFVTKLPQNAIGDAAINSLKSFGVDTTWMVRGGERLGIYFVEKGASQRSSVCIYDRNHSAIQESNVSDFDWISIFSGAKWFHFTGITPALGGNLPQICEQACIAAKKMGLKISCDLNYRKKLWTSEKAYEVMSRLCQYVDICMANEEDAKDVFGIEAKNSNVIAGQLAEDSYMEVAKRLRDKFSFEKVAITLRESFTANDNDWSGLLYDDGNFYTSKKYHLHIVDRIGGGDSFDAGLIYAILNNYSGQKTIEFAAASSALKHTIEGDFNRISVGEIEKLINGDGSGRVSR